MHNKIKNEIKLHHTMSLIGGFLGAYSLMNRNASFGSSMTANLLYVFIDGALGDFFEVFIRFIAFLIYVTGIAITVLFAKGGGFGWRRLCIIIEFFAIALLGFIPPDANYIIALYPVFFIAAMQWNVFNKVGDYVCSTIFSTNNIRQFTVALCEYKLKKSKTESAKVKFFGMTLVAYHVGAIMAIASTLMLEHRAIWICFLPLSVALIIEIKVSKQSKP